MSDGPVSIIPISVNDDSAKYKIMLIEQETLLSEEEKRLNKEAKIE